MIKIAMQTEKNYPVYIENDLLGRAASFLLEKFPHSRFLVVTDAHLHELWYPVFKESFLAQGLTPPTEFMIPAGEGGKTLATVQEIYSFWIKEHLQRTDVLIAFGGGAVSDTAGFAASTIFRGVPFVIVPTTLLAQVDAGIGGKTAVNLPEGKNLVGSFWQPSLVLCDPKTLDTLPQEELSSGMGEVLKYALIRRPDLFSVLLEEHFSWERLIASCVEIKKEFVCGDEHDHGSRMLLNFGHTLGHALEQFYRYEKAHGWCVCAGMAAVLKAQIAAGEVPKDLYDSFCALCEKFSLPAKNPVPIRTLLPFIKNDKKNKNGQLHAVLLKSAGKAYLKAFTPEEFAEFIARGESDDL